MNAQLNGLSSLLATIQKLYPQARVTSGYRGPDNPLTKRNPGSLHARGTPEDPNAVDVAPIPGVNFNDYVARLKGAGVPVAQAFDEQKHPFPWTTGPNWHIGQGQGQAPMPQALARKKPGPYSFGTIADAGDLMSPVSFDAPPPQMAPIQSLGDIAGGLPQGDVPKFKGLFPGEDWRTLASMALGAIGDGLLTANGQQPISGPAAFQRKRDEQQMAFDREKLNAELEARRQKALEPPQFIQNAMAWASLGPEERRLVLQQQDAVNPITVGMPQGPQLTPRTTTKTINGKRYYSIGGEWYEEGE